MNIYIPVGGRDLDRYFPCDKTWHLNSPRPELTNAVNGRINIQKNMTQLWKKFNACINITIKCIFM